MTSRASGPFKVVTSGFSTLEGPAFDRDGNLCFVDWETSRIIALAPSGEVKEIFNTGGIPAGLAVDQDGSLWVADEGDHIHGLLRIDRDGSSRVVIDSYEGSSLNGANDLIFAADGSVFFSDPWGSSAETPIGGFYRLRRDGRLDRLDSGLAFPNGVALSPDERYVYLAETYRTRILRYELRPDGHVGPKEEWAQTGPPSGPDGMAVDIDGFLYCAHYGGGRIDVFAPDGGLVEVIPVPGANPTNCAFGGPDNRTLFVTEVETGSIYSCESAVPGLPLHDGSAARARPGAVP